MDVLENYALEHGPNTRSPERIGYLIAALAPHWGHLKVIDINPDTCRVYQKMRGVSAGTIRRELGGLRAAINYEVAQGRLTRPVTVTLPPKPEGKQRWLTREEADALLVAAQREPRCCDFLPLFIQVGLSTGARKGAILDLRWPQIDLDKALINFNPPNRIRTSKGRPIIPIPDGLLRILREEKLRSGDLGYVINRNDKRIKDIKRSFTTACNKVGLFDVTPHTLRHTAGTWMAQKGVPLWQIAGFLGHSHERTTELYSHHHPDYLLTAKEALD